MVAPCLHATGLARFGDCSHSLRKPVPGLRTPGAIGRAGCRRQYPDPGIGNRFDLLAVISLTAQKLLPGRLAGEGKELRPARQDRCTQARARNLSECGQRDLIMVTKMGFHEIRETDSVIEEIAILMRLQ